MKLHITKIVANENNIYVLEDLLDEPVNMNSIVYLPKNYTKEYLSRFQNVTNSCRALASKLEEEN